MVIYRAMIRSAIDYGRMVYGSADSKPDRVQAKALRVCCGPFSTTLISLFSVEMGKMPLEIRRHNLV